MRYLSFMTWPVNQVKTLLIRLINVFCRLDLLVIEVKLLTDKTGQQGNYP